MIWNRSVHRALGRINRELGQMADSVTEVVYGIPIAVSTPVLQPMKGQKM